MEQFLNLYGGVLVTGFLTTLFLLASILFLGRWYRPLRYPHHTSTSVMRFGGVALILGFLCTLWQSQIHVFPTSWWVFCVLLGVILLVGLWDDLFSLHWVYQLGAQVSILLALFVGGVQITTLAGPNGFIVDFQTEALAWVGLILFLVWGVLILNTVNWLDGVDGLCASVMAVTYSVLFVLALSPNVYQPAIAILLASAVGGTLAFLAYNYPPAKIIGGTTGSLFFGLVLVFVSVVAGTKIATTLLVLALPLTDAFFVLGRRLIQKRSLFTPDQGHLHHILQKRGWSKQNIVLLYTALTLCIGVLALTTQDIGKLTSLVLVFSLLAVLLAYFHCQLVFTTKRKLRLALLVCVAFALVMYQFHNRETKNAWIDGHWYRLEIADTAEEREQGLSNRQELCGHCGMLFIFEEPQVPEFWMKDMQFALDVLWLFEDRVVAKHENLPFPSRVPFTPGVPVTKVIELPAGSAHDISPGTRIYFW